MATFEKWHDAHMVEVRMEYEKLSDSILLDAKISDLLENNGENIAHSSADDH
jgi:hypothetical protein